MERSDLEIKQQYKFYIADSKINTMLRNNYRKLFIIFVYLVVSHFPFLSSNTEVNTNSMLSPNSGRIVHFFGNNQKAEAYCVGKSIAKISSIYFKGPSGVKVSMNLVRNYLTGYVYTFKYIKNANSFEFKYVINLLYAEQGLPIPISASFNNVYIAGLINLSDGGNSERLFNSKIKKEFLNLPSEFQTGLKEFYLFLSDLSPGIATMAVSLNTLFEEITPYLVKYFVIPKSDHSVIKEFLTGFSQFKEFK